MKIIPNVKKCVGCSRCERICPTNGIAVFDKIPLKCVHCEDAPCLNVCPEHAIKRINNKVVVIKEHCIGCELCVGACPFGAMSMDLNLKIAYKCNGCYNLEEELCKKVCPTEALSYSENEVEDKRKLYISKLKKMYFV